MSRNTLRKYFRMPEETEIMPSYQRVARGGKLAAYSATLEQALKVDAHRTKQNRHTGKALFEQIKLKGFTRGL